MRPVILWAVLLGLMLAPVFAAGEAFNISAHLYATENASSVQMQTLASSSDVSYVLYTIGGIPSILTANGVPLTDPNAIGAVIREHQSRTLLPSAQELDSINQNILSFNASRNLKTSGGRAYPFGLEETCLIYTNLKYAPCTDTVSCTRTAAMLCARYDVGSCSPDQISPYLLAFNLDVNKLNLGMSTIMSALGDIRLDNGADQMSSIKTAITSLKEASASMGQNKLRVTAVKNCPDCLGICPEPKLDLASLDSAATLAGELSSRISGAPSVSTMSAQIVQTTSDRVAYAQSSVQAAIWGPKWDQFKAKYENLRSNATSLLLITKDPNVTSSIQAFQQLWVAMDTRVKARSFGGIESDFTRLTMLVPAVQSAISVGTKPLNDVRAAQNQAGDALIAARWRVIPSDTPSVIAYNKLVALKVALDANLTPPLTTAQYQSLIKSYSTIVANASQVRSTSDGDAVNSIGRRFSEKSVSGVFSLASAVVPISSGTRSQMAPAIPPFILLLADLAIASILLVLFIGILLYFRPMFRSRMMLGVWMSALFLLLFGLGLGSVGMYLMMNSNAQSGTLDDFMRTLSMSNVTYVAIDQAGAPSDAINGMASCANNVSAQLRLRFNKTVQIFSYTGKSCAWGAQNNLTTTSCFDRIVDKPVFLFHYNKTSAIPKFTTVYSKQAQVYGDTAYYTRCEIGDVLN